MLVALEAAARLLRGPQGEPRLLGHGRILRGLVRRGLAEEYRVVPGGRVHYRATPAGIDARSSR